jgi:hypothetical protein
MHDVTVIDFSTNFLHYAQYKYQVSHFVIVCDSTDINPVARCIPPSYNDF